MADKIASEFEAETAPGTENHSGAGVERSGFSPDFFCLVALLALEMVVFLPLAGQIGFYLDDWTTFANLHFVPFNFVDVLKASLNDPRMITRPVQCFYYAGAYLLFGDTPGGYHVLRCLSEAAGAFLFYGCLFLLTRSRLLAFVAAALFIVYPSHDCSHYWIGAGLGSGTGLTLYLLSLFFYIRASFCQALTRPGSGRLYWLWYGLSVLAFIVSAYCYEAFLPLAAIHFFADIAITRARQGQWPVIIGKSLIKILPFLFIGAGVPVYQRWLAPKFTEVFLSPAKPTLENLFTVPLKGLDVSLGPAAWQFNMARIMEFAGREANTRSCLQLIAVFIITLSCLWLLRKETPAFKIFFYLSLFSIPVMLVSYLPFAVADGYMPTLSTMINRVNAGASPGACAILASLFCLLYLALKKTGRIASLAGLLVIACFVTALVAADFGFSGYWLRSWTVQKHVRQLVSRHLEAGSSQQCLLLANCPRYTMWSPVFDGIWDFQAMCRIVSDNKQLKAGVISERLQFTRDDVRDYSLGHLCATYPYKDICLLFPSGKILIPLTAGNFVEAIKSAGLDFGLNAGTVDAWQAKVRGFSLVNGDDPQSHRE